MAKRTEATYVTVQQAAARLGVSRRHIWKLIRTNRLKATVNPLDRRCKLIETGSILELERYRRSGEQSVAPAANGPHPRPKSVGTYTGPVQVPSNRVKDYLRAHWHGE